MLMTLYTGLTKHATPLLEVYLQRRLKRGKEDPARTSERRGRTAKARENKPLVWFHAASVGESQALLALIKQLLADYPAIQVMVTTGTVTSAKLMAERLPAGAFHQYMPVDQPDWTESFLTHWHPDFVVWSESEFWPNMLAGIRQRNIPAVLLNARMSEKSFQRWQMARGMIGEMLKAFRLCLGQSAAEASRLQQLGAIDARASSNLKYASAPLPYDPAKLEELKTAIGARPLVLWAQTHPGEEEIACRIHRNLQLVKQDLLTIIVPRHPERGAAIGEMTEKSGLKASRRSLKQMPQTGDDIYIADTMGELGVFYRLCRLCVVAGSFTWGGHNPIEPGQLGCEIFYGPHMFNFATIAADFESRGAALRMNDEAMLGKNLALALQDPAHFAAMGQAAKAWTAQHENAVKEISALLAPFLAPFLKEIAR
jgi:3-deoxy-D-manno-octulosonic-acid transferase